MNLDQMLAEVRAPVFRLLASGDPDAPLAAAMLLTTYADDASEALLAEIRGPAVIEATSITTAAERGEAVAS